MGKFNASDAADAAKKAEEAFSFLSGDDKADGFEQINTGTMAIPFIRVLQKLSPQLDKRKPEYIAEAEEGMFFNTITHEVYGNEIEVVVGKFEQIFIEWRPDRGGFAGYHSPENAERLAATRAFGQMKTATGNILQENYVYMVLVAGHEKEGICVLSLASTALKVAREWNRLMSTHVMPNGQRALPYYLVWKLVTEYQENDKGTWYRPRPMFSRYVQEQEYLAVKDERKALPARQIDYRQLEGASEANDAETPF